MIRFVVILLLLAAVLYGVFWAIDRRNSGGSASPARPTPRGPVGPDDDAEFLRNLDRDQRRRNGPPAPKTEPTGQPGNKSSEDPITNPKGQPDPNPPQPDPQESNDHPE